MKKNSFDFFPKSENFQWKIKKIQCKIKKIIEKKSTFWRNFWSKMFDEISSKSRFFSMKFFDFTLKFFDFSLNIFRFRKIPKKYFFTFQNYFFFDEKKSWEKNRSIAPRQNFPRNPFLTFSERSEHSFLDFGSSYFFPRIWPQEIPT